MAIKFTDKEPEGKPAQGKADAPSPKRGPDAEALSESVEPELPHPKPEPKPSGPKKPLK